MFVSTPPKTDPAPPTLILGLLSVAAAGYSLLRTRSRHFLNRKPRQPDYES